MYSRRGSGDQRTTALDSPAAARRPDAVLCLNDQLALGALRMLHERGLRVPEDVAVVGFDDVAAGRFSVPTPTTVAPDKSAVAAVAVELLMLRIAESGTAEAGTLAPQERVAPHRLIVRCPAPKLWPVGGGAGVTPSCGTDVSAPPGGPSSGRGGSVSVACAHLCAVLPFGGLPHQAPPRAPEA